jgi:Domain of unknown function (DUF4055)
MQLTDPNHPGQIPKSWADRVAQWDLLKDVFDGLHSKDIRYKYLTQATFEPPKAYKERVRNSHFDNFFKPTIQSYAGLLSNFELLNDTPDVIHNNLDNINNQGDSLVTWAMDVDIAALRDDCCVALIDTEPLTESNSRKERSPWVVLIDIRDVFSPLVAFVDGEWVLVRVVILRHVEIADGLYGTKLQKQWCVYTPGQSQTIIEDDQGQLTYEDPVIMMDAAGNVLDRVPIAWYSISGARLMEPNSPPFLGLAELNVKYFQKESELDDTESKVNTITATRTWPQAVPTVCPPLPSGANKVIEIPGGGKVDLLEAEGKGLSLAYERQNNRIERMDRLAQAFLQGARERTATEAILESSQAKLSLRGIARRKESFLQCVFKWMARLSDPLFNENEFVGGVKVSERHLQAPLSAQDFAQIISAWEMGLLSRAMVFRKLFDAGWMPEGTVLEEVIEEELGFAARTDTEDSNTEGESATDRAAS